MIVENLILVELKSVTHIKKEFELQLVNYLSATKMDIGLLINFSVNKVEIRRKVRSLSLLKQ